VLACATEHHPSRQVLQPGAQVNRLGANCANQLELPNLYIGVSARLYCWSDGSSYWPGSDIRKLRHTNRGVVGRSRKTAFSATTTEIAEKPTFETHSERQRSVDGNALSLPGS
jgi:hypothetical protein